MSTGNTDSQQLPKIFPHRLSENYKKVHTLLRQIRAPTFNKNSEQMSNIVSELEVLLNDSMPKTEDEQRQRVQEYLHYHRDSVGYNQHINDAKLRFLVLWTDYKSITNHFRLRNVIHVRWNGDRYECLLFDKTKRIKQAARQNRVDEEDLNESTVVLK
jgi:hypothetical protein